MLQALLTPGSIAVIGASRTPGKVGHDVLANLVKGGFAGRIVPVNPAARSVLDLPCHPSLEAAGGTIDLGVIAVPPPRCSPRPRSACAPGRRRWSSSRPASGRPGRRAPRRRSSSRTSAPPQGVRLLGPNCLGLINTAPPDERLVRRADAAAGRDLGVLAVRRPVHRDPRPARRRGLGLAKLISIGNKADLDETDFLAALARDDADQGHRRLPREHHVRRRIHGGGRGGGPTKPVVILKVGTTAAGAGAASSPHRRASPGPTSPTAPRSSARASSAPTPSRRSSTMPRPSRCSRCPRATASPSSPTPAGPASWPPTPSRRPGCGWRRSAPAPPPRCARACRAAASVGNPIDVLGDADPERYVVAIDGGPGRPGRRRSSCSSRRRP